jgi:excisionase family DNA binding protein
MISFTIEAASKATHIGQDRIREAITLGNLVAHYVGTKAIIRPADLDEWIETLPTEKP